MMLRLVCGEIGHELTHTMSFLRVLRYVIEDELAPGKAETAEVSRFTQREIERLERMLGLVRRFRIPSPVLANVELRPLVGGCVASLALEAVKASVTAAVPSSIRVRVDASLLKGALHHLLLHAVASCRQGGHVTVSGELVSLHGTERAQLNVSDDGTPIADTSPDALFGVWDSAGDGQQSFHRAIAFRLLCPFDGTLVYRRTASHNVFQITLPLARRADS